MARFALRRATSNLRGGDSLRETAAVGDTVGSSAGAATVDGISMAIKGVVGASDGIATVAGVTQSVIEAVGASAGVATVNGVAHAAAETVGNAAGVATVSGQAEDAGDGTVEVETVGNAAGVATVVGIATNIGIPTDVIGIVPIRYILFGETANVVPVETVVTSEAGVVPCREFVGPQNVVPVRETLETPRVKVRLV